MGKGLFLLLSASLIAQEPDIERVSEAIGHLIGKSLDELGIDLDMEALARGLEEAVNKEGSPMSQEECVEAIYRLQDQKIVESTENTLKILDAFSNGDEIHENHPLSTTNSPKYW